MTKQGILLFAAGVLVGIIATVVALVVFIVLDGGI